jgi:hypothetical protein
MNDNGLLSAMLEWVKLRIKTPADKMLVAFVIVVLYLVCRLTSPTTPPAAPATPLSTPIIINVNGQSTRVEAEPSK